MPNTGIDEVVFEQVSLTLNGSNILENVTFAVPSGQFVSIIGLSGSGKTTLLRLVAGLVQPTSGQVLIAQEQVGMVFQSPTLLPWKTVMENVLLPLQIRGTISSDSRDEAAALLRQVGLGDLVQRYPHQLSGGQQHRVAIARGLIDSPHILLMDEPFAALDAITRERLQEELAGWTVERGLTVLFVTHDIAEAVFLSDRVLVLGDGGRIQQDLSISTTHPRTTETRYLPETLSYQKRLREVLQGAGGGVR